MKKILLLLFIPLIALTLSGCGKKEAQNPVADPVPTPSTQKTDPNAMIPSLPSDEKTAIDSEITDINQSIDSNISDPAFIDGTSDAEIGL